jgi:hypothetical protein
MNALLSDRPSTAAYRRPAAPPARPSPAMVRLAPFLCGALLGAVAVLALTIRPSAPPSIPSLSIEESTRRIESSLLDADAYAARGRAHAAQAAVEADPTEPLIRAIEDYERALGVGGEEWAHRALVEALQDAARFRLGLAAGNH